MPPAPADDAGTEAMNAARCAYATAPGLTAPGLTAPGRVRRGLRRWSNIGLAVMVFVEFALATLVLVTLPERAHLPGLASPSDGRWSYPPLRLPWLPQGKPGPFDAENRAERHYADLRELLLPKPAGARTVPGVTGALGWSSQTTYLDLFGKADRERQADILKEDGLRHLTAEAWTTPDGIRTEICLLQFLGDDYAAMAARDGGEPFPASAPAVVADPGTRSPQVPPTLDAYAEKAPYGAQATRYAWIHAGDVVALVLLTRPGSGPLPVAPLRQTAELQAQMLG